MGTHWFLFLIGCWVGVTVGLGLAFVLMGPKLRRLEESTEEEFFGPTLAYRRSAVGARRPQVGGDARPSNIA